MRTPDNTTAIAATRVRLIPVDLWDAPDGVVYRLTNEALDCRHVHFRGHTYEWQVVPAWHRPLGVGWEYPPVALCDGCDRPYAHAWRRMWHVHTLSPRTHEEVQHVRAR